MCRPDGVWIGVMEEECTESEHLPSIAAEECEVEEVVLDDNLDLEDMLPGDAKEVKIEANVEFESHRTHKASIVHLMLSRFLKSTDCAAYVVFQSMLELYCQTLLVKVKLFMLMIPCVHS